MREMQIRVHADAQRLFALIRPFMFGHITSNFKQIMNAWRSVLRCKGNELSVSMNIRARVEWGELEFQFNFFLHSWLHLDFNGCNHFLVYFCLFQSELLPVGVAPLINRKASRAGRKPVDWKIKCMHKHSFQAFWSGWRLEGGRGSEAAREKHYKMKILKINIWKLCHCAVWSFFLLQSFARSLRV